MRVFLSLVAVVVLFQATDATVISQETLFSGPQAGEPLTELKVRLG